ncbi:hypothetical protein PR048_007283 [Dryococelus australis]|uniref:Uncharacterized protein n=1 Tax=Dryococelus australis TaxID=614101 RepID=A0ABQ9ID64_9NEOP|nr:hypothetical protein PR048_007283 [Dryococelus australis]
MWCGHCLRRHNGSHQQPPPSLYRDPPPLIPTFPTRQGMNYSLGAAVGVWGASPSHKVTLLASHQGEASSISGPVTPGFPHMGSCRAMKLLGGFPRGSPFLSPFHSGRCSILTSITLIGSQELAVKSRPNLFARSLTNSSHWRIEHARDKLKAAVYNRPLLPETLPYHVKAGQMEQDLRSDYDISTLCQSFVLIATHSPGTLLDVGPPPDNRDARCPLLADRSAFQRSKPPLPAAGMANVQPALTAAIAYTLRGHGGAAAIVPTSQPGEPGSIPDGVVPGFSDAGIVPDGVTGQRVSSGTSRFPPPLNTGAALHSPRFTIIGSQGPYVNECPFISTVNDAMFIALYHDLCVAQRCVLSTTAAEEACPHLLIRSAEGEEVDFLPATLDAAVRCEDSPDASISRYLAEASPRAVSVVNDSAGHIPGLALELCQVVQEFKNDQE